MWDTKNPDQANAMPATPAPGRPAPIARVKA